MRQEAPPKDAGSVSQLLEVDEPRPVVARDFGAGSPFLIVCDHAGRAVPSRLDRLGLPDPVFETHIAWDIGALGYAERLAERLGSKLIWQAYSRLVIDCNRDPATAAAIPEVSDRVTIPANAALSHADRTARVHEIHTPYHEAIATDVAGRLERGERPLLICAHSFTPRLQDDVRPWHVGVLHGGQSPASDALLRLLHAEGDLMIGDNQPYAMDGTDYTAPTHAWAHGLDVVELEVRQDLIADGNGEERFAKLFARLLPQLVGG